MESQGQQLRSFDQIEVKLIGAITPPYELSVASARTCYSGKGLVFPQDVSKDERSVELRDRIASSTLEAGHLTTRQHAHFTFGISGVSRQFLWSFLHSHPFYNSEQVSQRYVRVKGGNFVMPPMTPDQEVIYRDTVELQQATYEKLIEVLKVPLAADFFQRFPGRKKKPEAWTGAIAKRSFEVARYVLGVGTTAYLYHTVSALTLLRYAKLCQLFDTPEEQRRVVSQMLDRVREIDPLFDKELSDPVALETTLEYQTMERMHKRERSLSGDFIADFDQKLDGKISKLVTYSHDAERILAEAMRLTMARSEKELPDALALELLLDPRQNKILADNLNLATLDRLSQLLHHVHFTFYKKISHTADSQDQRHRTVLSSRPLLMFHYSGKPDYVVPYGVTQSAEAEELYRKVMDASFTAINCLLDSGLKEEYAFYLLPNAFPIRMVSSGDLHSYQHKWRLRSCYNAQEEIFRATVEEVSQVKAIFPKIAEHLKAPCYARLRAGTKPYCPEGDRFCGLPVWKYEISQYSRKSL